MLLLVYAFVLAALLAILPGPNTLERPATLGQAGDQATSTLLNVFYAGGGLWRDCNLQTCGTENQDWGVDSATYALYLRWKTTHDPKISAVFEPLIGTATKYPAPCSNLPCNSWSDVPEWDTVALMRDYEATGGDSEALERARAAFRFVEDARVFSLGACPSIHYQIPGGKPGYRLKTLETDANYVKAALLLYQAAHDRSYLAAAVRQYAAIRRYFLDPNVPLYTVYVYDDGRHCTQLAHRFFASVNGDMIWSGLALARYTADHQYYAEAIATARAVDRHLSDGQGVFADLQAENDVEEPMVEAMYDLASEYHQAFARDWVVRNALAAISAREQDGSFPRFWDGPPARSPSISIWQSSGGIALEIAAAALSATTSVPSTNPWGEARFIADPIGTTPSTITFTGSGIALIGTMGARCCQPGHARVFIDGIETFDHTGIWQNKSMTGTVPNSVLFAWRWPHAGHHTIRIDAGEPNAKEGGSFIKIDGCYLVKP